MTWSITLSIFIYLLARFADNLFTWGLFPSSMGFPRFKTVIFLLSSALLIAYIRIGLHNLAEKYQLLQFLKTPPISTWAFVNDQEVTEWALVTLIDGTKYFGWISNWSLDPNETVHDFLLANAARIDDQMNVLYEIKGQGVYLKTSSVLSIEFYEGQGGEEESSPGSYKQVASVKEDR